MNNKKLLLIIFPLLLLGFAAKAQLYGNEWIDYSKTYYKFKVGKEGIYRISKNALDAAGVPTSINGSNFSLYREGQEIPVFVSTNGTFGSSDYIEFFGEKANGNFDKQLYENPDFHPNDRINMFTDTSCYFLTYDNQSNHLRYVNAPNNIPPSPPLAQQFSFVKSGLHFTGNFNHGKTYCQRRTDFLFCL